MKSAVPEIVCFDLGGVLVHIRHTWQAAAKACGVPISHPETDLYDLTDFPLFDAYQSGSIGDQQYLADLGTYLGVTSDEARIVHNAVLVGPYERTNELASEIRQTGLRTAGISNTNSLHWLQLNTPRFPVIQGLSLALLSHEVRLLKPDPGMFRMFDQLAQVRPDSVIFFDDHEVNVEAAQKHGWTSYWVDHKQAPARQIRSILVDAGVLTA